MALCGASPTYAMKRLFPAASASPIRPFGQQNIKAPSDRFCAEAALAHGGINTNNRFDVSPFDIVVYAVAIVAVVMGFNAGLLRSLATILGYLLAAPIAVAITPAVATFALGQAAPSPDNAWVALCVMFIAIGISVSALIRGAVSEFIGSDIGLFDRLAGAALGAARTGLVAILVVLVFDRIIPGDRQPQFLAHSQLRPYLSAVAQQGLRSLPSDVEAYIDGLKRERGI